MTTRVAITGFGRIGRLVLRGIIETGRRDIEVVAVNTSGDIESAVHLLKYDSLHGRFEHPVHYKKNLMEVGKQSFPVLSERDPARLAWGDLGVDVVMECTGAFNSKTASMAHIAAGAERVLISAPAENVDNTIVYGINHHSLKPQHKIVSNASCTTNALAPVAKVLDDAFGIEKGFMTTIHAYTGGQKLVDSRHKDFRRARAAALSMIPTSTGATKALGLVLPQLAGKLAGTAIRVPTANVSLIDLVFQTQKKASIADINKAMRQAAHKGDLQGILGYEEAPLVSVDFNHHPCSAIFDATGTQHIDDHFMRVMAWYDNEWGFSLRMADTAIAMKETGKETG